MEDMGKIMMEDPTYSCKLTTQVPLILLRGPPYSFSDSVSFKCGLCHNCLSSGYSRGWKDVHKRSFICQDDQDQHPNFLTRSQFDPEKIWVKEDYKVKDEILNELIRLPVVDVNSVNHLLTGLIQHLCVRNEQKPHTILVLVDDENENINISKFCDACTMPVLSSPYYIVDESYDFYRHKWCADLPDELKEHPMHPNHLLSLFMSTTFGHVFTCNSCSFPVNGFGFRCTECSTDNIYNICIRCASLPRSILHESHKHPLVLSQRGSSSDGTRANCCSDVRNATFTCEECGFGIHGRCALLPRTINHRYDKCHPFTLLYPTASGEDGGVVDPSSLPFCEICERNVSAKANEGWLYHCEDCDMFGCIECFSVDLNLLSMIKPNVP